MEGAQPSRQVVIEEKTVAEIYGLLKKLLEDMQGVKSRLDSQERKLSELVQENARLTKSADSAVKAVAQGAKPLQVHQVPQVHQVTQVHQVPQVRPTTPELWSTIVAKPKASKRPAATPAARNNRFTVLTDSSSDDEAVITKTESSKKARTLKPPSRGNGTNPKSAPGPARFTVLAKGNSGTLQRSAASAGPTPGPSRASSSKAPTPGPQAKSTGSPKAPTTTAPKSKSTAAPKDPKDDKKKRATKSTRFVRDVAEDIPEQPDNSLQQPGQDPSSSGSVPQVPTSRGKAPQVSTSKEVTPQVPPQVPASRGKAPQVSTSNEATHQVLPQVPTSSEAVPQVVQHDPTSSEVPPQVPASSEVVPQVTDSMETDEPEVLDQPEDTTEDIVAEEDGENATPAVPGSRRNIPPIIIRGEVRWVPLAKAIAQRRLNFSKAKTCPDGIRVQPVTTNDFRGITRLLDEMGVAYHTYTLEEDKTLRVVIKHVGLTVTAAEVLAELKARGFEPRKVTRMARGQQPLELMLVELPKKHKDIFNVKRLCLLSVTVEKQRKSNTVPQCHGCQGFHHSARNCKAQVRCVKCAGTHRTHECQMEPETPSRCANCDGAHTANHRGCPKFPKRNINGRSGGKPKAQPKATPDKPTSKRNAASPKLTARQEVDLQLQRSQLIQAIKVGKDKESMARALMAFIPLLLG